MSRLRGQFAIERTERPGDHQALARVDRNRFHVVVEAEPGVERGIHRAVGVEAEERTKAPGRDQFAIVLERHIVNIAVARSRVAGVIAAICVVAGDVVAAKTGEVADCDHFAAGERNEVEQSPDPQRDAGALSREHPQRICLVEKGWTKPEPQKQNR